ncbi:MAG TPA: hypothetical protein VGP17_10755 [Solirubrobacteraceae bacterium]|jgi:hypothetical protein|nr:hypothetical protein [Solirubrobacteraceae bacterium]
MGPALAAVPSRNEVVLAAIGASAALGGLILVFLGVVIAGYQAYPPGTAKRLLSPYRKAGGAILGVFALSLLCSGLGVGWLATGGGGGPLYAAVLVSFFVSLAAISIVAVITTYRLVLK